MSAWLCKVGRGCALVVLGLVLAVGCDPLETPHESPRETFERFEEGQSGRRVARVDERELSVEDFEAYWERHPEMERREALDAFIERELLVREGLKADAVDWSALETVRKRALVRALLRERVESEITEDDLSEEDVDDELDDVLDELGHPPGVRASHLLVQVPKKTAKKATEETRERWSDEQREWAERIRREVDGEVTAIELHDLADEMSDELPDPLDVRVESHLVFPFDGEDYGDDLPSGWTPVLPAFRDAAVDLAREDRFGELSEPVETKFGWHLIVAEELLPAAVPRQKEARKLARKRLVDRRRTERVAELVSRWQEEANIELYPELLDEEASLAE